MSGQLGLAKTGSIPIDLLYEAALPRPSIRGNDSLHGTATQLERFLVPWHRIQNSCADPVRSVHFVSNGKYCPVSVRDEGQIGRSASRFQGSSLVSVPKLYVQVLF